MHYYTGVDSLELLPERVGSVFMYGDETFIYYYYFGVRDYFNALFF